MFANKKNTKVPDLPYTVEKVRRVNNDQAGFIARANRQVRGIRLRALAGKLDCSPAYLSDLERGRRAWNEDLWSRYWKAMAS